MNAEPTRMLRIVRGRPTAEELAALVAVLAARTAADRAATAGSPPSPQSAWRERSRYVRSPLAHGPGAWACSALPR